MGTPDKAPLVEVRDAFEEDYFVGPPPSTTGPQITTPTNNTSARKRILNTARLPNIIANNYEVTDSSSVPPYEPVAYTPLHPTQINKAATRLRRGPQRRALNQTDFNNSPQVQPPPSSRPAIAITNQPVRPSMWSRFTAPPQRMNLVANAPPSTFYSARVRQPQPTNSSTSVWPNQIPQPRFGSAPNFTTFGNTTTQTLNDWRNQYLSAVQQQLQQALEASMIQQTMARTNVPPSQHSHLPQQHQPPIPNLPIPSNSGPHLSSMIQGILNGNNMAGITNSADSLNPPAPAKPPPSEDDMAQQDENAGANQDEEYHEVETYADYVPAKLTLGQPHPDPVVETSSLSTVEAPDIQYKLKLPSSIIDKGLLSALQLESVIYACQQHSHLLPDDHTRQGFLIGDGAGVGKGRTIAGIIYENFLCGRRKSIWLSVSTDLKLDAERDLKDIGAKIPVHLLGKFIYGRRINEDFGVIFSTYSGLVSKSQSIRGPLSSRIGQLIAWAGTDFDGVIVFDECHKAKNIAMSSTAKQSKAATFALELQSKLPRARVVYASATGASETRHLGYMTRLGIWGKGTAYETFSQFCGAIEKRGVGAMELVAVDLKMRGSYIARQLSFKTTSFDIHVAVLDQDFVKLYDECVEMWSTALRHFTEAARYFAGDKRQIRSMWATFWAAHQKFFKYLCIGAKVPLVTQIAKQALEDGKCVVIGLQSTGEAKALEAFEKGDTNEFVSTAKATFESLIENHFPAPRTGNRRYQNPIQSPAKSSQSATSTNSSESTIDTETWVQKDSVAFVLEDGIVKARVEGNEKIAQVSRDSKRKQALEELRKEQSSKAQQRSSRALRARLRARKLESTKSRIKKLEDDSDTEISNPLSSNSDSHSKSRTSSSDDDDYNSESSMQSSYYDEEDETLTDPDESELSSLETKPKVSHKLSTAKREQLDSDDSDVVITAVKPRKNYEVIMLSSDDDGEEEDPDANHPMIVYGKRLTEMRDELYKMIDNVGGRLPNNTLDDLIDRLGGPTKVAEMTGRKGRLVKDSYGRVLYCQRNDEDALDNLNIAEKERFMKGQKLIAIISEAASSGISLQADKRVANKRRRVHITIELPWSADRAIQQFGRTHRSNQLSGPEYVFVISELAGEKRFASIVAKRLESLGALTHGDRRATTESRDLSQFNLNSKYTRDALRYLLRYLETGIPFAGIYPNDPRGTFLRDAKAAFVGAGLGRHEGQIFAPDTNANKLSHFLNRLLGMKVQIQNAIFKLFTDYMERLIARDKVIGQHDAGILELNSESGKTKCDPPENFELDTKFGRVKCSLWNVQVERGISWDEAIGLKDDGQAQQPDDRNGFYISDNPLTGARMVLLAVRAPDINRYRIYKPNTGRLPKLLHITEITGSRVPPSDAKELWERVFTMTNTSCIHMCLFNKCSRVLAKLKCDVGLRHRNYCILSGGILTAWPYLEMKAPNVTAKLQIVRLKLDTTNRVIGPVVPQEYVRTVRKILLRNDED